MSIWKDVETRVDVGDSVEDKSKIHEIRARSFQRKDVYICAYTCVYACMHVRMHVYMYLYMLISAIPLIYTHTYTNT